MHQFIRSLSTREIVSKQVPAMALSIGIAELFYKFHSFTLECLAFLATWYLVDLLIGLVFKLFSPNRTADMAPTCK